MSGRQYHTISTLNTDSNLNVSAHFLVKDDSYSDCGKLFQDFKRDIAVLKSIVFLKYEFFLY